MKPGACAAEPSRLRGVEPADAAASALERQRRSARAPWPGEDAPIGDGEAEEGGDPGEGGDVQRDEAVLGRQRRVDARDRRDKDQRVDRLAAGLAISARPVWPSAARDITAIVMPPIAPIAQACTPADSGARPNAQSAVSAKPTGTNR